MQVLRDKELQEVAFLSKELGLEKLEGSSTPLSFSDMLPHALETNALSYLAW